MTKINWPLTWAVVIMAGLVIFLYSVRFSHAHDHARPELDSWFNQLKSGKGPCCDASEATRVDDADWETRDGHYRVRLDGVWIMVEDSAVITEPNRAGRTMVWPFRSVYGEVMIRCFMPGSMT
jgi:hypothetical protein